MPLAELLLSCQYEGAQAQAQTNDLLRVLRQLAWVRVFLITLAAMLAALKMK